MTFLRNPCERMESQRALGGALSNVKTDNWLHQKNSTFEALYSSSDPLIQTYFHNPATRMFGATHDMVAWKELNISMETTFARAIDFLLHEVDFVGFFEHAEEDTGKALSVLFPNSTKGGRLSSTIYHSGLFFFAPS